MYTAIEIAVVIFAAYGAYRWVKRDIDGHSAGPRLRGRRDSKMD